MEKVKVPFGLLNLEFWPVTATPAAAHPTYGEPVSLGAAVKFYITVQLAEGSIYGDDVLQLSASEFSGADVQTETLLSDLEVQSKLFGAQYSADGGLVSGANDVVVTGALRGVQKLKTKTGVIYRAVLLYQTTPIVSDFQADTKGESVSFLTNPINFKAYADNTGAWRHMKDFDTLEAAETWLGSVRAGTATT